jgi:hypothetical protein
MQENEQLFKLCLLLSVSAWPLVSRLPLMNASGQGHGSLNTMGRLTVLCLL